MIKTLRNFLKIGSACLFLSISQFAASAYTTTSNATLYSEPSNEAPVSHQSLPAKTSVTILSSKKGFTLVKTNNDELGWIQNNLITVAENTNAETNEKKQLTAKKNNAHSSKKKNAVVEIISSNNSSLASISPGTIIPSASSLPETVIKQTRQESILESITQTLDSSAQKMSGKNTDTLANKENDHIFDSSPNANRIELLSEENKHLRSELEKAKNYIIQYTPSSNSPMMFETNELLKSKLELLRSENTQLEEKNIEKFFFNKLIIFVCGTGLGFLISKMLIQRNRHKNW